MDTWVWIVVAVVVALIILAMIGSFWNRRRNVRRTQRLQQQFGAEYERSVRQDGRAQAESELAERQKRVEDFNLRPLLASEAQRFVSLWTDTQARFVDDPGGAVSDADRLVGDVMQERGYPVGDFEQRAADVSVDHPQLVSNYRAAHNIADRHSHGQASTEDLRQAMVHYRALFTDLLETAPEGASNTTMAPNVQQRPA
jgi:hypothetical protein